MSKFFPLFLWLAVIVAALFYIAFIQNRRQADPFIVLDESGMPADNQTGIAYSDVAWDLLPTVPRFELTNQKGEPFDSADLLGRPMAVSFFFATCPNICRDLNKQIQRSREQLNDPDMMFVSVSVHPENDTPEILDRYSADFGASPQDWNFLTGQLYKIEQLGKRGFGATVARDDHTDNIFLIDRWGRFRDRFKWDEPTDMKRFQTVAQDVLAEKEPPLGKIVNTRNVLAGVKPAEIKDVPWIHDFHLIDQDGAPFFSRELTGQAWICNFFLVACPGICPKQTSYLSDLQKRMGESAVPLVSITTAAESEGPEQLRQYAEKMNLDLTNWKFLTGDPTAIKRIGIEYFHGNAVGVEHSSLLYVVDRWGNVRGEFDWQLTTAEEPMLNLIERLNDESVPPARFDRIRVGRQINAETEQAGQGSE